MARVQLDNRGKRITENLFDVMMENDETGNTRFELNVDLMDLNVFVDREAGLILFEDDDDNTIYSLTLKQHQ